MTTTHMPTPARALPVVGTLGGAQRSTRKGLAEGSSQAEDEGRLLGREHDSSNFEAECDWTLVIPAPHLLCAPFNPLVTLAAKSQSCYSSPGLLTITVHTSY